MGLDLGYQHLRSVARLTAIALLALYGCEKQFTPQDTSRMSERQLISYKGELIDKVIALPCIGPEERSFFEEIKRTMPEVKHHHPRILKDLISGLEGYLMEYERIKAAGASCDDLKSRTLSRRTD